jgi:hypothetical protein
MNAKVANKYFKKKQLRIFKNHLAEKKPRLSLHRLLKKRLF